MDEDKKRREFLYVPENRPPMTQWGVMFVTVDPRWARVYSDQVMKIRETHPKNWFLSLLMDHCLSPTETDGKGLKGIGILPQLNEFCFTTVERFFW